MQEFAEEAGQQGIIDEVFQAGKELDSTTKASPSSAVSAAKPANTAATVAETVVVHVGSLVLC